jgi:diguanylate cyclase (GGDEF)-like protein/PAS domain S-box-containing protein
VRIQPTGEVKNVHHLHDSNTPTPGWIQRQVRNLDELLNSHNPARPSARVIDFPAAAFTDITFEDMAQITLDAIGDAVLVVDPKGKVIYLNKVAEKLTGWSYEKAIGQLVDSVFIILDGESQEQMISPSQQAINEERTVALALGSVLIRRDGTGIEIEDSAAPIYNSIGEVAGAVIVFHDARQSESEVEKMSHLAQHDSLTGLPNRVLLMERLTQAIGMASRHSKQLALLFLDLDHFKSVNDTFGHAIGDQLLQDVAADIVACVRATDTVCRQGGDEFIILLTQIEEIHDSAQVAEKLLARFAQPRIIDGHEIHVSLSIGISVYPENGLDAETLMQNADTAMYLAKENGRNTYQFSYTEPPVSPDQGGQNLSASAP